MTTACLTYGGGVVMFWFHAVVRGEHGPAISDPAHWLLDPCWTSHSALPSSACGRHSPVPTGDRRRLDTGMVVDVMAKAGRVGVEQAVQSARLHAETFSAVFDRRPQTD